MYERISSQQKDDGTLRIVLKGPGKLYAKAHAVPLTTAFDKIGFRITVALCDKDGTALKHEPDSKGIAKDEDFEFHAAAEDDTPLEERGDKLKADFDACIDARAERLFKAAANRSALGRLV